MAIPNLDLSELLGQWPRDYRAQEAYLNKLMNALAQYEASLSDNLNSVLTLEQGTEPTSVEWEAAWTSQTGQVPPVPPLARLYWWDSANSVFGGEYGTIEGNSDVVRREHFAPKGSSIILDMDIDLTSRTFLNLYGYKGLMPSVDFEIPVTCDIWLYQYSYFTSDNAAAIGCDFLVTNQTTGEETKVGTDIYGLDPDGGINEILQTVDTEGIMTCAAVVPDLPAGNYSAEMMVGYVGTPVTPPVGGIGGTSKGSYYIIVRAIVSE
jgi:hypothetical protein